MRYLDYLRVFIVVYRENGSIRSAAEKVNLTPSAVSKQIKVLESLFEEKLFIMRGRLLYPTPGAHKLAGLISSNIDFLSNVIYRKNYLRKINLGIDFYSIVRFNLELLYTKFLKKHKNISLEMFEANSNEIMQNIKNYDFVVTYIDIKDKNFGKCKLYTDKYYLAGNKNINKSIIADSKKYSLEYALNNVPWIMFSKEWVDICYRTIKTIHNIELRMEDLTIINSSEIIKYYLKNGDGVGIVSQHLIEGDIIRCDDNIELSADFNFYYKKHFQDPSKHLTILKYLKECFSSSN